MWGGAPRISILLADFDPNVAGSVHADVREDRVVVTWNNVPQYGAPENLSTFQLVLHSDGRFEFDYDEINFSLRTAILSRFAVVGIRGAIGFPASRLRWTDAFYTRISWSIGEGRIALLEQFPREN